MCVPTICAVAAVAYKAHYFVQRPVSCHAFVRCWHSVQHQCHVMMLKKLLAQVAGPRPYSRLSLSRKSDADLRQELAESNHISMVPSDRELKLMKKTALVDMLLQSMVNAEREEESQQHLESAATKILEGDSLSNIVASSITEGIEQAVSVATSSDVERNMQS